MLPEVLKFNKKCKEKWLFWTNDLFGSSGSITISGTHKSSNPYMTVIAVKLGSSFGIKLIHSSSQTQKSQVFLNFLKAAWSR